MPWLPEVHALEVVTDAAGDAEEHADVHGGGVRHHLDVGVGVDALGAVVLEHAAEVGDGRRRARRGTVRDAHAALAHEVAADAGRLRPARARSHAWPSAPRGPCCAWSCGCNSAGRSNGSTARPGACSGLRRPPTPSMPLHRVAALAQARVHRRPVVTERADGADAGDDDPLHPTIPPLTEITWRVM